MNICLMTDSYKVTHWKMYPNDLKYMYSFFESRGGDYNKIVFFGLQYYLKKYLEGCVVSFQDILEAREFYGAHFGSDYFNLRGWKHILTEHNGRLPVEICAVDEGGIYSTSEPLITIVNTDSKVPWLTNWLETLLVKVWYPCTVATRSYSLRCGLSDLDGIDYRVHDFGYRGCTSEEQAALGGAAHLLSFSGTDTVAGIKMLQDYYNAAMPGHSIPATEHSVIMSHTNEFSACNQLLDEFPSGLVACVSDTYDIGHCVEGIWGNLLRNQVLSRDGCLVVRPDSGNYMELVPKIIESLGNSFGWSKPGLLNEKVRVIQGDGMDEETIIQLYQCLRDRGLSPNNLTVGSGGGLLQKMDRDTCKFAFKCSWVKDSLGGRGVKKTAPGKISKEGKFNLEPVFRDGKVLKEHGYQEINLKT